MRSSVSNIICGKLKEVGSSASRLISVEPDMHRRLVAWDMGPSVESVRFSRRFNVVLAFMELRSASFLIR
jgi:hypothetical protein